MKRTTNFRRLAIGVGLATALTTASTGLAPSAAAHGVVEPREVCVGHEISAGTCNSRAVQPIPGHITEHWRSNPHGSRHRKIEIAQERAAQTSDCSTTSGQGED